MEEREFDFEAFKEEAMTKLKAGKGLTGSEGAFTPLLKHFIEASMNAELETHIEEELESNRKNGKNRKKVRTSMGELTIEAPRDRLGTFNPKLIPKRQKNLPSDIERQIFALYARGTSVGDIRDFLEESYNVEVSTSTISRITDKVLPEIEAWRNRPLECVYPFVYMDAIHFKVREEGRVVTKAVYCVIGVNQEGYKDLLGLYVGSRESAKFWMQVLTDLQNRGVDDILIACIDNLSGFVDAIQSIYPKTDVQLCVIHQIRNSKKYLSYKDTKEFMGDLRTVYTATSKEKAEHNLNRLKQKWDKKYPKVIESWYRNWDQLSTYFQYSPLIRQRIYTTNLIENFHRQLRKVTKTKGSFTSDNALLKLLFLVQRDIVAKWKKPMHNWNQTLSQLSILYDDRLRLDL